VDEAVVVADRSGLESAERERLLRALGHLCDEVFCGVRDERWHREVLGDAWLPGAMPSREDEQLVEALRASLGRLASAARSRRGGPVDSVASQRRRLDGVEFVIRRKILMGERGRLPRLLPGFVFLVVLPLLGHAEALELSERASRLLDVA
jgi:hypothetical protein